MLRLRRLDATQCSLRQELRQVTTEGALVRRQRFDTETFPMARPGPTVTHSLKTWGRVSDGGLDRRVPDVSMSFFVWRNSCFELRDACAQLFQGLGLHL